MGVHDFGGDAAVGYIDRSRHDRPVEICHFQRLAAEVMLFLVKAGGIYYIALL